MKKSRLILAVALILALIGGWLYAADQRILYTEELVGATHPTKSDTINRITLVDHGNDGQHTLAGFQGSMYAADAAGNDTYVITLDPVPGGYFNGMVVNAKVQTANTGAATLNCNTLGAIAIKKLHDQDPVDGDLEAGQIVTLVYNSTGPKFQMIGPVAITPPNSVLRAQVFS